MLEPDFRSARGSGNKWLIVARSLVKFTYGKCLQRKKNCVVGVDIRWASQAQSRGWGGVVRSTGHGGFGGKSLACTLAGGNWIYFLVFRGGGRGRRAARIPQIWPRLRRSEQDLGGRYLHRSLCLLRDFVILAGTKKTGLRVPMAEKPPQKVIP